MKPTKQQLEAWLKQRHQAKTPPPTPAQIRQQLGWDLGPNNKRAECAR